MKKLLLIFLAATISTGGYAKRVYHPQAMKSTNTTAATETRNKTTAVNDTLSNIAANDTLALYYADITSAGGFLSGTDEYGDLSFAERYDFNATDSNISVIGVLATFGGVVNSSSTKTVSFNVWDIGSQNAVDNNYSNYYYSGLPNNVLDSQSVAITDLGITAGQSSATTYHAFATPTASLATSFYVGYTINYDPLNLGGDTIGVYTSRLGSRTSAKYIVDNSGDTIINVQNATQYSDSSWNDNYYDNDSLSFDYAIYPVVVITHNTTGINSITKNNLTFFGNYPNPAVSSTNITFSLAQAADMTITVTDMAGRTVSTLKQNSLSQGAHTINLSTATFAAGDYLYILHTSGGDGIAGKLTVIK